ncbi:MAG: hypothetical protein JRG85_04305 [Deltaproteobacteria bacterium]|nr:hypothetical protein [Deltaproteobacteria bacterium]
MRAVAAISEHLRASEYHAVATRIADVERGGSGAGPIGSAATVQDLFASEEPTNAGADRDSKGGF